MVGSAIAVSFLDYENIFHIPALIMGGSFIIGNIWPDVWDRVMSLGSHALWEKIHRTFSHWIWLYFIGLDIYDSRYMLDTFLHIQYKQLRVKYKYQRKRMPSQEISFFNPYFDIPWFF
jgi:uncharacterized membrane protein